MKVRQTRVELVRNGLFGLIAAYIIGVFVYLGLRLLLDESRWWMGFLNTFANLYFMPALVLLPLALLLRARRAVFLLIPVLLAALIWYSPYLVPPARASVPANAPQIRIITLNTWGRNIGHARGEGYASIAAWLRAEDADVVLLQEVPPVERLREDGILGLDDVYPTQFMLETHRLTNATLTRLPVLESASYEMARERPRHQRTVVEVAGQPLAIYTVHLHSPFRAFPRYGFPLSNRFTSLPLRFDPYWRNNQIDWLLTTLADEPLPYIVAGDFNLSDRSLFYDRLAASMTDSFLSAGWGFGTSWRTDVEREGQGLPPLLRIDYLWHNSAFVSMESEQGPFVGSDHLPLLTTLAMPGT